MKKFILILVFWSFGFAQADEGNLELMLGLKGGIYQTSGNLFAERNLRGWGLTLKLIPDDFGKAGEEIGTLGGIGWMMSFDLDHLSGSAHTRANFPFSQTQEIHLTWSVLAVYVCAGTQLLLQTCIGVPVSNSLYLEQNVAGDSFNSFSMGNSNPPAFLNLFSAVRPWNFGLQAGSSYWNPTFAGNRTHFNLIQGQFFFGYLF